MPLETPCLVLVDSRLVCQLPNENVDLRVSRRPGEGPLRRSRGREVREGQGDAKR